jgi:hypothetical protein
VILTKENIESLCNLPGGFTRKTLAALGVDWPPKKGWKFDLIGKEIPDEQYARAMAGKKKPRNVGQGTLFGPARPANAARNPRPVKWDGIPPLDYYLDRDA